MSDLRWCPETNCLYVEGQCWGWFASAGEAEEFLAIEEVKESIVKTIKENDYKANTLRSSLCVELQESGCVITDVLLNNLIEAINKKFYVSNDAFLQFRAKYGIGVKDGLLEFNIQEKTVLLKLEACLELNKMITQNTKPTLHTINEAMSLLKNKELV